MGRNPEFLAFIDESGDRLPMVLGFDLSKTHSAALFSATPTISKDSQSFSYHWGTDVDKSLRSLPRGRLFLNLRNWVSIVVRDMLKKSDSAPVLVGVEGYAFGNSNRSHLLGEIGGVVRMEVARLLTAHDGPVYFVEVNNLSTKRWMSGGFKTVPGSVRKKNGELRVKVKYPSKAEMVVFAQKLGVNTDDHNVADAAAVVGFIGSCFLHADHHMGNGSSPLLEEDDGYILRFLTDSGLDGGRLL